MSLLRMLSAKFTSVVLIAFALSALQLFAAEKETPPSDHELAESVKVLQDAYRNELRLAKSAEQKAALATKLLEEGRKSTDSANRYALFETAKKLYLDSGSYHKAIATTNEIAKHFEIDALMQKYDILSDAATARTIDAFGRYRLVLEYEDLIKLALQQDKSDLAMELAELAEKSTRRASNRALSDYVKDLPDSVKQVLEAYTQLPQYRETLKSNPNDPQASFELGIYHFLIYQDYENAIPLLKNSSADEFKVLATLESASVHEPLKLGDGWWKASEMLGGLFQKYARIRAAHWYEVAFPSTSGLEKTKVELRINEARNEVNITGKWVEPGLGSAVLAEDKHKGTAGGSHANNVYYLRMRSPQKVDGLQVRINGQMTHLATGTSNGTVSISFDGEDWIPVAHWTAESCRQASNFGNWHQITLSGSELLMIERLAVKLEYTSGSDRFDLSGVSVAR